MVGWFARAISIIAHSIGRSYCSGELALTTTQTGWTVEQLERAGNLSGLKSRHALGSRLGALDRAIKGDFAGLSADNRRAVIQAYVFPLVSWIWIGTLVLIGGTLTCLVPSKAKMEYARTEVVGYTKKDATVKQ